MRVLVGNRLEIPCNRLWALLFRALVVQRTLDGLVVNIDSRLAAMVCDSFTIAMNGAIQDRRSRRDLLLIRADMAAFVADLRYTLHMECIQPAMSNVIT